MDYFRSFFLLQVLIWFLHFPFFPTISFFWFLPQNICLKRTANVILNDSLCKGSDQYPIYIGALGALDQKCRLSVYFCEFLHCFLQSGNISFNSCPTSLPYPLIHILHLFLGLFFKFIYSVLYLRFEECFSSVNSDLVDIYLRQLGELTQPWLYVKFSGPSLSEYCQELSKILRMNWRV